MIALRPKHVACTNNIMYTDYWWMNTSVLWSTDYITSIPFNSFSSGATAQRGPWPPHSFRFLDHTQWHTTVSKPLHEGSACRKHAKFKTDIHAPGGFFFFVFSWTLLVLHSYFVPCPNCPALCLFVFTCNTQHKHPYPLRDSNPQPQKAVGRSPSPYTTGSGIYLYSKRKKQTERPRHRRGNNVKMSL